MARASQRPISYRNRTVRRLQKQPTSHPHPDWKAEGHLPFERGFRNPIGAQILCGTTSISYSWKCGCPRVLLPFQGSHEWAFASFLTPSLMVTPHYASLRAVGSNSFTKESDRRRASFGHMTSGPEHDSGMPRAFAGNRILATLDNAGAIGNSDFAQDAVHVILYRLL